MGQENSTEVAAMSSQIPQIQTTEDLIERYQKSIPGMCFNPDESDWFNTIFEKFGSSSSSGEKVWTQTNLFHFLSLFFPCQSSPILEEAMPILYHWLLHLGSFPYLRNPAPELTLPLFRLALILLFRRDEQLLNSMYLHDLYDVDGLDDDDYEEKLVVRNRRLMFMSLATYPTTKEEEENGERRVEDDEDFNAVYEWVQNHNYERGGKGLHSRGPELPPQEHFPSSYSKRLDGVISRGDLRVLVRLLLVTALYDFADVDSCSHNADDSWDHREDAVEHVTDCTMAAFTEVMDSGRNIRWEGFNQVVGNTMPNLFKGISRIFGPLIRENPTILPQLKLASPPGAADLLQQAFPAPPPYKMCINSKPIRNLPLLCQLSLFLPSKTSFRNPRPDHSWFGGAENLPNIKMFMRENSNAGLLLVSQYDGVGFGVYVERETEADEGYEKKGVGIQGANRSPNIKSIVFQYEPVLRVFRGLPLSAELRDEAEARRKEFEYDPLGYWVQTESARVRLIFGPESEDEQGTVHMLMRLNGKEDEVEISNTLRHDVRFVELMGFWEEVEVDANTSPFFASPAFNVRRREKTES